MAIFLPLLAPSAFSLRPVFHTVVNVCFNSVPMNSIVFRHCSFPDAQCTPRFTRSSDRASALTAPCVAVRPLATDHSGRATHCVRRSGRLVSTPAPSALSVASPCGRRTRNRLACWALASAVAFRAGSFATNHRRARFAPGGRLRRREASARMVEAFESHGWRASGSVKVKTPSERLLR